MHLVTVDMWYFSTESWAAFKRFVSHEKDRAIGSTVIWFFFFLSLDDTISRI